MKARMMRHKSPGGITECVSGVLIDEGSVLVEKRRADDDAEPGLAMLPGGHVEMGESFEHALEREMREELGIVVGKVSRLRSRPYTSSNGERQRIHYYHVKDWRGRIKSNEAESVHWESDVGKLSDVIERKIVLKLLNPDR